MYCHCHQAATTFVGVPATTPVGAWLDAATLPNAPKHSFTCVEKHTANASKLAMWRLTLGYVPLQFQGRGQQKTVISGAGVQITYCCASCKPVTCA